MATWASLESPRRALSHPTLSLRLCVLYVVVCSNMCARIPPTNEKLPKCLLTRSRHRHVIVTTRRAAKMRRRSEKWGGRWRADIRGRKRPPRAPPLIRLRRVQPRPQNVPWSTIEGGAAHIGYTALAVWLRQKTELGLFKRREQCSVWLPAKSFSEIPARVPVRLTP